MSFDEFLYGGMMSPSWANDMDLRQRDASLRSAVSDAANEIRQLKQQVDKLRLVSRALCELLTENSGLTEGAILDRIDEIDLRDGSADGRMKVAPVMCPACNRTVGLGRLKCQYCGAEAATDASLDDRI
jgi:hypothetical protein